MAAPPPASSSRLVRALTSLAVVIALLTCSVESAGDPDGFNSGPHAQELHLNDDELPRSGPAPGAGLADTIINADVLVAGGGSSGVSAALAAARSGAKTVLVHGRPVLGGNAGSEIKLAMVGACGPREKSSQPMYNECREGGIVEEYTLDNAVGNPNRVAEIFSLILYNKMRMEPNIQLFLNTWLVSAHKNGSSIVSAVAEDQMSQNRYNITAKVFIDATGDGRLGAEAGAEFIMGREGPLQYNESIAEGPDNETEGSSLAFVAVDQGVPQPFTAPPWARKFNETDFKYRSINFFQYGYWWIEVSWPYNTIRDNEKIRDTLLENLFGVWDFIKNSGKHPESQTWALQWFGNVPCKREGRRFIGQFVSTQNDIMADPNASPPQHPMLYPDRVAYAGWPFDLHNPKGILDTAHPPYSSYPTPYMFSTALGSLVSKNVDNLMFAGRLSSFSHVVFGSQRVMKTCSTMGQAAGTAAAYAAANDMDAVQVLNDPDSVWSIQQQLLRDDAYIIAMYNEDPRDYARTAKISATNETADGPAKNIVTGQTRAVVTPLTSSHDRGGVPIGHGINGTNRWRSGSLPAAITLSLQKPASIAQAELIFDTGMHRKLTFSVRQGGVGVWSAQPETVRHYTIEGLVGSSWQVLCNVTDNFQRRRVHQLPCSPINPPHAWPPLHPGSSPTPAPPGPQSNGLVAQACSPLERGQLFSLRSDGRIEVASAPGQCVGVDDSHAATGGHGQAIVAMNCNKAPVWTYSNTTVNGSTIALPKAVQCINYQGTCQCAKIVAPENQPVPGAAIELWDCHNTNADGHWQFLRLDDDSDHGLLSADGLCLDATKTALRHRRSLDGGSDMQDQPPTVSSIRVNVTATNGVDEARILEVRLYDQDGIKPFPKRGKADV